MGKTRDLRREASDPTTPGARLQELSNLQSPEYWAARRSRDPVLEAEVHEASGLALLNPNYPPERLVYLAQSGGGVAVWRNPSLPLIMLTRPHLPWESWAQRLVYSIIAYRLPPSGRDLSLAQLVAMFAVNGPGWGEHTLASRAFVGHLAGLFSLPWPEESAPLPGPGEGP